MTYLSFPFIAALCRKFPCMSSLICISNFTPEIRSCQRILPKFHINFRHFRNISETGRPAVFGLFSFSVSHREIQNGRKFLSLRLKPEAPVHQFCKTLGNGKAESAPFCCTAFVSPDKTSAELLSPPL